MTAKSKIWLGQSALTVLCCALGGWMSSATPAWAQTAVAEDAGEQGAAAQDEDTDELVIEGLVVTAQKRSQLSQDVGITMTVIPSFELESTGAVAAPDIARITPGMNLAGSYAGQGVVFSIRGTTQQDFSAHVESPVAVYMDDAYFAVNNVAGMGLFDLDHVEVLKGPQGTLFGRNATGGLVNLVSKKPDGTTNGYLKLNYGSYDSVRLEMAASAPLSDKLSGRIAGVFDRNAPYIENISPTGGDLGKQKSYGIRAHLLYEPTDNLSFLLTGYHNHQSLGWGPYFSLSSRSILDGDGNVINDVIVNDDTLLGTAPSPGDWVVDANDAQTDGAYNRFSGGTLKATWDFGPELTSVTDYKKTSWHLLLDNDASPVSFLNTDDRSEVSQFSQELRLYEDLGGFRWYAGVYYLYVDASVKPDGQYIFPALVRVDSSAYETTRSTSVFGQIEYDFASDFTLLAGVRVTDERKKFDYDSQAYSLDGIYYGEARTPYSGKMNDTLVNAKLELDYRPTDNVLVYLGWNRGAKAGNFNAPLFGGTDFPDSDLPYKPEVLNSFEAGVKSTLFNNTTTFNVSGFYYDYQDYQSFHFINLSSLGTNHDAKTYGADVELMTRPIEGLTLSLSGAYIDNTVYDVDLGSVVTDTVAPFTSEWSGTALVRYEWPFLGGRMGVQGDIQYTGEYYFGVANYDAQHVDGYAITNARLTWDSPEGKWGAALFVQNAGDEEYQTVGYDLTGFCGCTQTGYGKPRWIGGSITYNW